ncbi:MAG: DEAD/DEAH box helicase family protein [Gammaproteobacteria bacterium]
MTNYPKIGVGKRAVIAGQTGAGKSILARWLLYRSPGHWIILNPKWTAAFDDMESSQKINGFDYGKIEKSLKENRFTIVNPMPDETSPEMMDEFILEIHNSYKNVGLCVDELYMIHTNGRPGKGLTGWLTRGRELKQSFLGLTQRPAWVSKFIFSEADYIGSMFLNLPEDRKRMFDFIGNEQVRVKLPALVWFWYTVSKDNLRRFGAVPIDISYESE